MLPLIVLPLKTPATRGDNPNLLFLAIFWISLLFLLFKEFLAFLIVFIFFPKDFRGLARNKNPCFFGGFPCLFLKKARKRRSGKRQGGPRFGSVTVWGWNGSSGSGFRFRRFL